MTTLSLISVLRLRLIHLVLVPLGVNMRGRLTALSLISLFLFPFLHFQELFTACGVVISLFLESECSFISRALGSILAFFSPSPLTYSVELQDASLFVCLVWGSFFFFPSECGLFWGG